MFVEKRRQAVMTLLNTNRAVSVREFAQATQASDMTIRRDLAALAAEGRLSRRRGGAVVGDSAIHESTYGEKEIAAPAEKRAIGAYAAHELVEDGDALLIGAGSTTQAFVRALRGKHLSIVTNSILVAHELAGDSGIDIFVTGGSLRGSIYALVGVHAERSLSTLNVPKLFISGNGLTVERGLSTPNMLVASIDRAMAAAADNVYVLVDHTKVGIETMVQTVALSKIRAVVTDSLTLESEVDRLREAGVEVFVVPS